MNILVIGDVTSPSGVEHLKKNLWNFRKENGIDFCVVNGENASFVTGISEELAEILLRAGFSDRSAFYRAFAADTGMTPSEYAKTGGGE